MYLSRKLRLFYVYTAWWIGRQGSRRLARSDVKGSGCAKREVAFWPSFESVDEVYKITKTPWCSHEDEVGFAEKIVVRIDDSGRAKMGDGLVVVEVAPRLSAYR